MNQHVVWTAEIRELNLTLKNGWVLDMWEQATLNIPPKPSGRYQWMILNPNEPPSDDYWDVLKGHHSGGTLDEALVELEVWLWEQEPLFEAREIWELVGQVRRWFSPEMLDAGEYQRRAMETAIYPESGAIQYTALGLASEAGEFAGHVKKMMRDDEGELTPQRREALLHELGGVAWYVAAAAKELGFTLGDVLAANIAQLADRKKRGVIRGEGDKR